MPVCARMSAMTHLVARVVPQHKYKLLLDRYRIKGQAHPVGGEVHRKAVEVDVLMLERRRRSLEKLRDVAVQPTCMVKTSRLQDQPCAEPAWVVAGQREQRGGGPTEPLRIQVNAAQLVAKAKPRPQRSFGPPATSP